jgi:hypothetical protein
MPAMEKPIPKPKVAEFVEESESAEKDEGTEGEDVSSDGRDSD